MKITTENVLNIQKQPDDFCTYIDPVIQSIQEQEKLVETITSDVETDINNFDTLHFDVFNPPKTNLPKFADLIVEMKNWSNSWIERFEIAINKEQHVIFKNDLESDLFLFKAQAMIFNNSVNVFNSEVQDINKNISEHYKYIKETLIEEHKEIKEGNSSNDILYFKINLNDALFDLGEELKNLSNIYELLREAAARVRDCINDDVKIKSKIQMTRIKEPDWMAFLDETKNEYLKKELTRESYKTYLTSTNRNHF